MLSLAVSQSTRPHTVSVQPPHPVVARVAAATSPTEWQPSSQAPMMSLLVTPLQRQIVASAGISVGDASAAGTPVSLGPVCGTSSETGSAGRRRTTVEGDRQ